MTRKELDEMETKLLEQLAFAKSVQANTKNLEKQLEIVDLAKIGLETVHETT